MPLMKLAMIFCRPKPMPMPTAPDITTSAERLMPTAFSTTAPARPNRTTRTSLPVNTRSEGVTPWARNSERSTEWATVEAAQIVASSRAPALSTR